MNSVNEHEIYRRKLKEEHFKIETLANHIKSTQWIEEYIKEAENLNHSQAKLLFESLNDMTEKYFFEIVEENGVVHFYIIDKSFESICNFFVAGNGSNRITKELINKYNLVIEIKALHSYEKNKGKDIVNSIKEVSHCANIPISLFDTNNKDINYYSNLGFVNKGKKGIHGEVLFIYEPKGK
ncbi:hypothetical protein [Staphylococcus hominis]|uniref:hypothetical protein n=1 Tax=Staphylococcus hominis TaxID=1290 RepID=UPI001C92EDBF|nr:hypothetical protein [Staphylococcus hominis]